MANISLKVINLVYRFSADYRVAPGEMALVAKMVLAVYLITLLPQVILIV